MKILIIDSSPLDQEQLKFLLNLGGYFELVFADTAEEAFEQLNIYNTKKTAEEFDLILIDIFMKGIEGLETCKKIKSKDRLKDIPLIVVTKDISMENMLTAFDAGAVDYISKPLDNKIELLPRVNSALKLKKEMETRKTRERELLKMTVLLEESNKKLQRANEMLKSLAAIDSLTGVANRRYFNNFYQREWRRSVRLKLPISILMIDIDYFKAYNDIYGHQKGDDCLKRFAQALKGIPKRPGDLVARYGGEEFVILLSDTDMDGAEAIAKLMQQKISKLKIEHTGSMVGTHVTFSAGIAAIIPDNDLNPESLITAADKALYQAKQEGRDNYKIWDKYS